LWEYVLAAMKMGENRIKPGKVPMARTLSFETRYVNEVKIPKVEKRAYST
jgi:hypothetical protein